MLPHTLNVVKVLVNLYTHVGEHYYYSPAEILVKDCFLSIVTKVTVTQVAIMKFYGREYELNVLNDIFSQCSNSYGKITVLTGRRRIGKTLLAKEYDRRKDALYLFTSKKTEKLLCEEFLPLYEELTGERYIGVIERFVEIFELFMKWGMKKPFVLIIDEF